MSAEDQIRNLKQIPPLSKEEKRKNMRTSIVLAMATLISILFLIYAFMQKLEADKQRALAVASMEEANKQRAEAEKMKLTAQYQEMQARKQAEAAEAALVRCEESKKK